ncbi:MAG: hypothetical protein QM809_10315 [Gordonia sp. (in: high G+C Gram-positive bacteria)]|uniref:hypothetical protein n=1 Tax=Gordonia sp. (in: high G+C Gram-positive bacteria) TaxID=84139 RepID=UPI0039E7253E
MSGHDLLDAAIDFVPEAWHDEIAADAAGQGYDVTYTEAPGGLHTDVVRRVLDHVAAHDDQPLGDQLDGLFPGYHGIGSGELLDELGLRAVYTERST